jgi:hypothetical protein
VQLGDYDDDAKTKPKMASLFATMTLERLTLDDALESAAERSWIVSPADGGVPPLAGQQILELKYQHAMPAAFKDLVVRHALVPRAVSKYRLAVAALGLAGKSPHA